MQSADKLAYSIKGAADALDCSVRHIYNLRDQRRIRILKMGRKSIIPASDLRAVAEGEPA